MSRSIFPAGLYHTVSFQQAYITQYLSSDSFFFLITWSCPNRTVARFSSDLPPRRAHVGGPHIIRGWGGDPLVSLLQEAGLWKVGMRCWKFSCKLLSHAKSVPRLNMDICPLVLVFVQFLFCLGYEGRLKEKSPFLPLYRLTYRI